ncbi:hypothetical protein [Brevibacillus sp. 179-C9.3 HS]|uniref:hypothetical protein n=1 Tax=unclassified Brevibacillus TaxID=2684853 RepID=UPI0039A34563
MLANETPIIQDYFSFLKGELIEVLKHLSSGDPWQDHMMGYELPDHSDGDDSLQDGIIIFLRTYEYMEIHMDSSKFYSCLVEICNEYLIENSQNKEIVHSLMIKVKEVL